MLYNILNMPENYDASFSNTAPIDGQLSQERVVQRAEHTVALARFTIWLEDRNSRIEREYPLHLAMIGQPGLPKDESYMDKPEPSLLDWYYGLANRIRSVVK